MGAVDFAEWAAPGLELTWGGRTYMVPPPTVRGMRQVLAAAVRGEINLGLVSGPTPPEVVEVLDTIGTDEHPALGPVFQQLADDGVPAVTIDRMSYYAAFYWARGREYADVVARWLWERDKAVEAEAEDAEPDPKD